RENKLPLPHAPSSHGPVRCDNSHHGIPDDTRSPDRQLEFSRSNKSIPDSPQSCLRSGKRRIRFPDNNDRNPTRRVPSHHLPIGCTDEGREETRGFVSPCSIQSRTRQI